MTAPFRVALLGFSDFERGALASYFRLASRREPGFEQVERAAAADFLLVDGDQPEAMAELQLLKRELDAIYVGSEPPETTLAWITRPIDPLRVLRELHVMAVMRSGRAPAADALPVSAFGPLAAPVAAPPLASERAELPLPEVHDSGLDELPLEPPAPPAPPPLGLALVVDDSAIAQRFLEKQLVDLGLEVHRAATSQKAQALCALHDYCVVLIDVELGEASESDGLALCHQMRHEPLSPGRPAPLLVLVSAHQDAVDKVRGTLAGCDAYLAKPLDVAALRTLLARRGIVRRASHRPR